MFDIKMVGRDLKQKTWNLPEIARDGHGVYKIYLHQNVIKHTDHKGNTNFYFDKKLIFSMHENTNSIINAMHTGNFYRENNSIIMIGRFAKIGKSVFFELKQEQFGA